MGLLMLLISLILGFIVTIVINRVKTMYYSFLFIIFGIWFLIHYWDSLFPIIQVIEFVIIFRFLTVLAFIFVRLVVVPRNKP
jgi:vacuolar-type H+-ATPase subunit I/STV1